MLALYCQHFGLTGEPFNNTPDAQFLYRSPSHSEALAQLIYGIDARKGFVVLTGEVGTGKTLLIRTLLQEVRTKTKTALIFTSVVNSNDLLRGVCEEFELVSVQHEKKGSHDYLVLLNEFLLESYTKGENAALIIDEAQNLPAEVLESIRLLSNFETPQAKLLQIILVGQPELTTRLNSPALRQLKQRIVLRHHLKPLSLSECREYVARRLEVVGGNLSLFDPEAIQTIYHYSSGIPRLINILCDNGMLTAYALGKNAVDFKIIREAGHDLHLSPPFRELGGGKMENEAWSNFRILNAKPPEIEPSHVQKAIVAAGGSGRFIHPEDRNVHKPYKPVFSTERVPTAFFERMITELTDAMGPMAGFIVRDHVARLGESIEAFPQMRLGELIDAASQEIFSNSLKTRFRNLLRKEMHGLFPLV